VTIVGSVGRLGVVGGSGCVAHVSWAGRVDSDRPFVYCCDE
jgi:hypothetical protein